MSNTEERKKSPNLVLTKAEGNYVIGDLLGRYEREVKTKGRKFTMKSALIKVEDTNGSTVLWDGEKEVEVPIEAGDAVFLKESGYITSFFNELKIGDKFKLTFEEIGKAKKGQNAPYIYNGEKI